MPSIFDHLRRDASVINPETMQPVPQEWRLMFEAESFL